MLGLTALLDTISVYIGPSPKEREKEERKDRLVKMSKQLPPAPTASTVGPCPTVIQIVGRPGTGSLPSTIAPPDHPVVEKTKYEMKVDNYNNRICMGLSKDTYT